MKVYIDIETIPAQDPKIYEEIAANIPLPELVTPTCPKNFKKAETINQWEKETLPGLMNETKQKYKDACKIREKAIDEAWRKTALNGELGEIICIGWAVEDAEPSVLMRDFENPGTEAEMLNNFFSLLNKQLNKRNPSWVGFNLGWDLRFIYQRCVIRKVLPTATLHLDARPWEDRARDVMYMWAGAKGNISLDRLCKALGVGLLKGTEIGEPIDGGKVWDFVKRGEIVKVGRYNAADIIRTRECYKRLVFSDLFYQQEDQEEAAADAMLGGCL